MPLTTGLNHVALLTSDLDVLIEFYVATFDAELLADMEEGGLRHAMLDLGHGFALHPFSVESSSYTTAEGEMFHRGHLDHFALNVDDDETFELLRRRLVDAGASDGTVTDFGMVRTVGFVDPDGCEGEIAQWRDGPPLTFDERVQEPYVGVATA
jgi:catechol 2,3-dioxygenase-like lactoylglutathione lyase family enzyme